MEVLFCTEASPSRGHGHVMRCRYLAGVARDRGIGTVFLASNEYTAFLLAGFGEAIMDGSQVERHRGPVVIDVPRAEESAVVQAFRRQGCRVLMLDAHGEARTLADVVCDAMMTVRRAAEHDHSRGTIYLYGLSYACLDMRFARVHASGRASREKPRLLIAFGGSDPVQSTPRLLQALNRVDYRGPVDIVAGQNAAHADALQDLVVQWADTRILSNVSDMASQMIQCDLVVTKVGLTMLEAFCVGAGCVMVEPTPLHVDLAADLALEYEVWPAMDFGLASDEAFDRAAREIAARMKEPQKLAEWGRRGAELVDGLGASRVMDVFLPEVC